MKHFAYYMAAMMLVLSSACQNSTVQKSVIKGKIENAKGELLILEHMGSGRPTLCDTLRLDSVGAFKFTPTVEQGPDYFCLRIASDFIPVVVDSLNREVEVSAQRQSMATGYVVSTDLNNRVKQANLEGNRLRRRIFDVNTLYNNKQLSAGVAQDSIMSLVAAYKKQMLDNYIYSSPTDPVSYYVLFQTVGGLSIFDPLDPQDNRAFGAIATSWKYAYPNSPRCKALEKLTLEGQAQRKSQLKRAAEADSLLQKKVDVKGYFDITLPDLNEKKISLSSIVDQQNKVVLLDFTSYALPVSVTHNIKLAEIYERYKAKGVEIYQVSVADNENFWKVSANNIPWIAVRDQEAYVDNAGNIYSAPATLYNISQLPTTFVLSREGNVVGRAVTDAELEAMVKTNVK